NVVPAVPGHGRHSEGSGVSGCLTFGGTEETFVHPRRRANARRPSLSSARAKIPTMMIAHDSGAEPPHLSAETTERVSRALSEYIDHPGTEAEALRLALHTVAREARALAMPPEQLLVALKALWYGLPQIQRAPEPEQQARLLQRVVSMCIR